MKILIGEIAHETNTFSNVKTDEQSFRLWGWDVGEEILTKHRGVRNAIGGMIDQAEKLEIDILPTFTTFAYPAGIITTEAFNALRDELIGRVKEAKGYDAVVLSLHGAGVAEPTEDFEGTLLTEIRAIIGNDIPLIVTLDLHANMTEKMVEAADVIIGNHLYPHTDSFENGMEAVELAKKIVEGTLKPTMYLSLLPMIIPTSTTNLSPAKDVNELCYQWEASENVVDCTFYHGFPYTNISNIGVGVLVTTNDNAELAQQIAEEVSDFIWKMRHDFIVKKPNPKEGIELALKQEGRPIILNETSDNPGGGTPGDGTFLLRQLIDSNLESACFGYIYDPETVRKVSKAGVGATVNIVLGGKTDSLHGEPIETEAYVKSITDGRFIQTSPMEKGTHVNLGLSVRVQCNGIDVIICSVKSQTLDEQVFLLHGIDVRDYKIVGLKSSQHFRAGFEPICKGIITVDSPGLTTLDFSSFNYSNLKTKLFPLHEVSYRGIKVEI
ncbi:M81 family metallopeptidase [Psychrobacillus sp.]|uniref:M81 family metallopeptidase n=1 Tax=Psychrobacillus sp. TaxID=1871623 RepID=UPI0028BE68BC|nr:M81 family metallopeptidase [Psychrobacillus sp.]